MFSPPPKRREPGDLNNLLRALKAGDIQVRRQAVRALGKLGDAAAVPRLAALLKDRDRFLVQWSIEALGLIGDPTAIEALVLAAFSNDREVARLAAQALASIEAPEAQQALALRDTILRSDWPALDGLSAEAGGVLGTILRSEQYEDWPSAKRKEVAAAAMKAGATPGPQRRGEMADMGYFVSGVHTLGEVLQGLKHKSPEVRIAAAERLAISGLKSARGPLYRRFRKEISPEGDPRVQAAMARALEQLGDLRAVETYARALHEGGARAGESARMLAMIGTGRALEALFWFAAEPPPAPAYRNVGAVMTALESLGPRVVDLLYGFVEHPSPGARRTIARLIAASGHRDAMMWLGQLGMDPDPTVQLAAINGLGQLNSAPAAQTLRDLAPSAPRADVLRALARISNPAGQQYLRALHPSATTISGLLLDDQRQALTRVPLELQLEQFMGGTSGWKWQPAGPRIPTDEQGQFYFSILSLGDRSTARLRVFLPGNRSSEDRLMADMRLRPGAAHRVEARMDAFVNRLLLRVDVVGDDPGPDEDSP